jgi:hypothetical protein
MEEYAIGRSFHPVWSKNSISLKTRDIVEGAMPTLRGDFSLM